MSSKLLNLSIINGITLLILFSTPTFAQNNNIKSSNEYWPKLKVESVIQKAKEYIQSKNIDIQNYYIGNIEYKPKKEEWEIFFQGNYLTQGKMIQIIINDRTEKIEFNILG
jgi:hypothetical protein